MRKICCMLVFLVLIFSACRGREVVPDVEDFFVPTAAVPTVTPTPMPTATAVPNILEIVRVQAEVNARVLAEAEAEGVVRMTVEQFQAWQAEQNRHTEEIQETTAESLVNLGVAFAVSETVDDATRNTGAAAAMGLTLFLIVGFVFLARSLGKDERKEGGG